MSADSNLKSWAGIQNDGDGVTLAVVFTDIMDSTKLANTLGNQAMFGLLREHFKQARGHCQRHNGFEIKLIGDGYMAAFRTAADALQFALAFRQDTGDPQISIRVGIDQGKVRIWENDIYGLMINYAARLLHCSLKDEEGIYISNAAQREIKNEYGPRPDSFRVVPLGRTRPMKGFDTSDPVYQVVCRDLLAARQKRSQRGTPGTSTSQTRGERAASLELTSPPSRPISRRPITTGEDLGITLKPRPLLDLPTRKRPSDK